MEHSLFACLVLATAVGLPAQATWVVGGSGGLPQIRDALAVAAPGDTILVRPGTYAQFTASLGVTIRAQQPGTVTVAWNPAFAPPGCANNLLCLFSEGPTLLAPPANQTLTVVGVTFEPSVVSLGGFSIRHRLAVTSGRVVLEDCSVGSISAAALTVTNATLHLLRGEVIAMPPTVDSAGIWAANAAITAVGTRITCQAPFLSRFTGPGMQLSDTTVVGSNLQIRGASAPGRESPAIACTAGALWLSDSLLESGHPSVCAISAQGTSGGLARCTLSGAVAGCPMPGAASLLGVAQANPPVTGQPFQLQWSTDPNGLVGVLFSFALDTRPLPIFAQPWWSPAGSPTAGLFLADALGVATGAWQMPADPAFVGVPLWFHSFGGTALPLTTAAPVGGILR